MLTLVAESPEAQEALGGRLARALTAAAVIYLQGDLGAGKTTLVRGLLHALGHAGAVRSPTYTLLEPYQLDGREIYHLDLYRLADPEELEYLGIRDLLNGTSIILVEWPERGHGALPAPDLLVHIHHLSTGRRLEWEGQTLEGQVILARLGQNHRPV